MRPERPVLFDSPAEETLEQVQRLATGLRQQLLERLPGSVGNVVVQVSSARVFEISPGGGHPISRRIDSASLELGPGDCLAPWTRIALLDPGSERWPSGWIEAVDRASLEWSNRLPQSAMHPLPDQQGSFVLDPFAGSDLVRIEAHRLWLASSKAELPNGTQVASPEVYLTDPGFAHRAAGEDRDALGEIVGPILAVENGRWLRGPDEASGSAVAASWKSVPSVQWRSLELRVGSDPSPWPDEAWVVTRISRLGGGLRGAGYRLEVGEPVERWGPAPLPASHWWLESARAELGDRLTEATGLPVVLAPLLIREH